MSFYIQNTPIGEHHPPYIIAELSVNHNGSLERAKLSMKAAKASGASAVKIQSYTADTMTIDSDLPDFLIKGGLWDGYTLYDLYKEAQTPFEWHEELFHFAKEINLTLFSSPFDETAVDMLEKLNAPAYKVASFEIVDLPLIKYIAATKKPLFMSTGMASEEEISEAISVAKKEGCNEILLFHCISSYPAPIHEANLLQMLQLKEKYHVEIGLSDHTMGNTAAIAAVSLGASAIEKHFTLSRAEKGPDSTFSMEPDELKDLVTQANNAKASLGTASFDRPDIESGNQIFRRSIYFVKNLKAGHIIEEGDIRRIRPGYGLKPKFYDEIIGASLKQDVHRGQPVSWNTLER